MMKIQKHFYLFDVRKYFQTLVFFQLLFMPFFTILFKKYLNRITKRFPFHRNISTMNIYAMRWKFVFRRSLLLPLGISLVFCLLCYIQIFGSTLRATNEEGKRNYYVSNYFWVKIAIS